MWLSCNFFVAPHRRQGLIGIIDIYHDPEKKRAGDASG